MLLHRSFAVPIRGFALCVAVLLGILSPFPALAEIMLYPTRVVIEGGKRSAQVEIINRGEEPETYRIRVVNQRMTELGEIVPAETAQQGEQFADAMVRYTPRQVTLQPGASQTIRISIRKPADLAPGEYRSHLQFDRIAETAGLENLKAGTSSSSNEVSIVLRTLIGASIPVIVRHGDTGASVTVESLQVLPGIGGDGPGLGFTFRRTGNRSVFGDVVATYVAPGKEPVEVGRASGIAVYVPNAERKARLPFNLPNGIVLRGGEVRLRYHERADAGGALIAQAAVRVP